MVSYDYRCVSANTPPPPFLGGGVPPGYPHPDPISDKKMSFFTPISRRGLQNPYLFSDLDSKKLCHHYLD